MSACAAGRTRSSRTRSGWDLLHVPYADSAVLAEEITSYGPDAVVEGPGDVLDGVLRRLRTMRGLEYENARDQVQRLLALVPYLRENDGARVDEVAAEFGVRPKQIIADLKVLWFCGLPGAQMGDLIEIDIDAAEGEGVIHLNNADYLARPLRLAADEALALLTALRTLREVTAGHDRDAVDRAIAKLERARGRAPPRSRALPRTSTSSPPRRRSPTR